MTHLFDRLRSALRPAPLLPNVTNDQYKSEREAVNVLNSMARIVQLGPHRFRVIASDWPSIKEAETAASKLAVILNTTGHVYKDMPVNEVLDTLGEAIRRQMNVDDTRPFGMCFYAEPL